MSDKIDKALKRLDSIPIQTVIRGGKVTKIPAQEVSLPCKDGVQTIIKVPEDITE